MKKSIKINNTFFKITMIDVDTCNVRELANLSDEICNARNEINNMINKHCYCFLQNDKVYTLGHKKENFKLFFEVKDKYLYCTNTCSCAEKDSFQTKIKIDNLLKKKSFNANATVKVAHVDTLFQEGTIFKLRIERIPDVKTLKEAKNYFKIVNKSNIF